MVKYKNLKGRFEKEIVSAVDLAQSNVGIITEDKLRRCVKKKLEKSGIIRIRRTAEEDDEKIGSHDCYMNSNLGGQSKSYGIGKHEIHSKEISICIENISRLKRLHLLSDYILHEFAHSCGWKDGENKGVPFPNGYPEEF